MRTKEQMCELKDAVFRELQQDANECGFGIFNHLEYARKKAQVSEKTIRRITQQLSDDGAICFHGRAYSRKVISGNIGVIYSINNRRKNLVKDRKEKLC